MYNVYIAAYFIVLALRSAIVLQAMRTELNVFVGRFISFSFHSNTNKGLTINYEFKTSCFVSSDSETFRFDGIP